MSHEVERHGEHGCGDAVEVDFAAVVRALVDHPNVRRRLGIHDLIASLRRRQSGFGQQPRKNRGRREMGA